MRIEEESRFTIHRTATRDWYCADEVDTLMHELVEKMREVEKLLETMKG